MENPRGLSLLIAPLHCRVLIQVCVCVFIHQALKCPLPDRNVCNNVMSSESTAEGLKMYGTSLK